MTMPNTTHNVFRDTGYRLQAKAMAAQAMAAAPKCGIQALPSAIEKLLADTYLRGVQDGLNTGYRLAEQDIEKERREAAFIDGVRKP